MRSHEKVQAARTRICHINLACFTCVEAKVEKTEKAKPNVGRSALSSLSSNPVLKTCLGEDLGFSPRYAII